MTSRTIKAASTAAPHYRATILQANIRIMQQIWAHRRQIALLFWRDFNAPHKRNMLGVAWAYIMPVVPLLGFIMVRTIIRDPNVKENSLHPAAFVALGVTLWFTMRSMVFTPIQSLMKYSALTTYVQFPLVGATLVGFGTAVLEFLIRVVVCAIAVWLFGLYAPEYVPAALALMFASLVACFGLGMFLVPILVAVPDLRNVIEIFFRYAVFFSGAIWAVPEIGGSDWLLRWNPFAIAIKNIRDAVSIGEFTYLSHLYPAIAVGFVLLFVGLRGIYVCQPQLKETLTAKG